MGTLLKNAKIVNEGTIFSGHILIENERIAKVFKFDDDISSFESKNQLIDIKGNYHFYGDAKYSSKHTYSRVVAR